MNFEPNIQRNTAKPKGAALVMVLMFIALFALIAVGMLMRVTSDRSSSAAYSNATRSRTLTEYAVNAVMTQISKATTQGDTVAWASQPGMLRTFPASASNTAYKLYSAPELTLDYDSPAELIDLDLPPDDWAGLPAIWTNLNEPLTVGGENKYPILDPAALGSVEGFSVNGAPGATDELPVPMPVQWLYLLEDGTLAPGTPGEGSSGNSTATVVGATKSNPIVGRIAFWTDDETCKVNINTSSEGTFWDTPRMSAASERSFANFQPARREFQSYPGHPAMTSLAPIFFATDATTTPDPLSADQRDAIYDIIPRIVSGGSEAGRAIANEPLVPDSHRLYTNVDELLFSIDRVVPNSLTNSGSVELITQEAIEQKRFFLTATSRAPEVTLFNTPRVAMWPVYRDHKDPANADRVTAFDRLIAFCASTPPDHPYHFQREDSKSPTNDWVNILRNRELLRFLRALSDKPVPGFGASLVSKTTPEDRNQLLVEMFDYIRSSNLYDDNLLPLYYPDQAEADSSMQFTSGRRVHDFLSYPGHGVVAPIRVPSNFGDTYPSQPDKDSHMGFGRFHTISEAGLLFISNADGKNGTFKEPLDDAGNPLSGSPTSDQLARLMSNVAPGTSNEDRTYDFEFNNSPTAPQVVAAQRVYPENNLLDGDLETNERRIQMMLFFDYFTPMHGWTQYGMDGSLDVEVEGSFSVGGQTVTLTSALETVNLDNTGLWGYHPWGAYQGYRKGLQVSGRRRAPGETGETALRRYGLISEPFTVDVPEDELMAFQGPDKILVKLYSRQKDTGRAQNRTDGDLVQTIELKFPDADFPIPTLVTKGSREISGHTQSTLMHNWWSLSHDSLFETMPAPSPSAVVTSPGGRRGYLGNFGRLSGINNRPYDTSGNVIRLNDTLRTLVPYHADFRLIAGSHYVPEGVFQPSTFYFSPVRREQGGLAEQIQCYMTSSGGTNYDAHYAFYRPAPEQRLVESANYHTARFPKFPGFAVSDAERMWARPYQQTGDFDNGIAHIGDGAYLNKPDEGNTSRPYSGAIPYFTQSWKQAPSGPTFFTPNRQIPGPGMFGSLPTQLKSGNQPYAPGVAANQVKGPWQTLLIRPQSDHPGAADPPDHLWMDFFWMPVVEPYAISEPFSTAGKINLNYAIAPFSYIRRATGLACLMRSEKMMAVPTSTASTYKTSSPDRRYKVAIHETLKQLDRKFSKGEIYKSATEICDIHLVPDGTTLDSDGSNAEAVMEAYWQSRAITGDNSRERPYTNLHARLATKSNVYTIHYRVEVLKKGRETDPDVWVEGLDSSVATFRGATTVERYLDPNLDIPDYAAIYSENPDADPPDLGTFYKFRILADRQFNP